MRLKEEPGEVMAQKATWTGDMIKAGALQAQKDRLEDEFASVAWDQRTLFSEMNS